LRQLGGKRLAQACQLVQIGALQADLHRFAARPAATQPHHRADFHAGDPANALAQDGHQFLLAARALAARLEQHGHGGVVFALRIAAVDRGVGVGDFRVFAHDGFDLPGFGCGVVERRTDRRRELDHKA